MPINATHRFAAYLTKEQNRAYESGDKNEMKAADQQALQDALQASLKDAPKASKAEVRHATSVPVSPVDPRKAQDELTKRAEQDLNRQGFQLVKTRNCAPNCLLVALLQHASGEYAERLSSALSSAVKHFRSKLVHESAERCKSGERKTAIRTDDRLDAGEALIPWLARQIFAEDVRVHFYGAHANGKVVNFLSVGEGQRPVNIFDCGGSFKAIVPASYNLHKQDPEPYV